jgi:hypothetical protein
LPSKLAIDPAWQRICNAYAQAIHRHNPSDIEALRTRPRAQRDIRRVNEALKRVQQLLGLLRMLANQSRILRIQLNQVRQIAQCIGDVDHVVYKAIDIRE